MPTKNRSDPATLTVDEAAQRLGISRTLAYELARRDELPVRVIRLGRRLVVPRPALEILLTGGLTPTISSGAEIEDRAESGKANGSQSSGHGVQKKPP